MYSDVFLTRYVTFYNILSVFGGALVWENNPDVNRFIFFSLVEFIDESYWP